MERTQISLTREERRVLDQESARTGRSISALIRAAVETVYGEERCTADDLASMRRAFGTWPQSEQDGRAWVDRLRSGSRAEVPGS
ncbi:MAG: ribbon-helix-helix protein, CopG family [Candidatus Dormiibacterota bacterium]